MPQNEIELFGIKIMEPMVAFSDLVITVVCLYFFLKMRQNVNPGKTYQWFTWYFFLMGLTFFFGGIFGHAFLYAFSFNVKLFGWVLSCISNFFIQRAVLEYAKTQIQKNIFTWLNIFFILLCFATITLVVAPETSGLHWVLIHTGLGLIGFVLPFFIYSWYQNRNKGSLWIIGAVTWTILTGIVNAAHINIHQWFNHFVLAHVLMTIFFVILYKGVTLLNVSETK